MGLDQRCRKVWYTNCTQCVAHMNKSGNSLGITIPSCPHCKTTKLKLPRCSLSTQLLRYHRPTRPVFGNHVTPTFVTRTSVSSMAAAIVAQRSVTTVPHASHSFFNFRSAATSPLQLCWVTQRAQTERRKDVFAKEYLSAFRHPVVRMKPQSVHATQ